MTMIKEAIERACLNNASLSYVVGMHKEVLMKLLVSAGGEHNMMNKKRSDATSTSAANSMFYSSDHEEVSDSMDRLLLLLLLQSDESSRKQQQRSMGSSKQPIFPCGIVGLLSIASLFFSSVEQYPSASDQQQQQQQQQHLLQPSAYQCIQFLQAVARYEDAFYAVCEKSTSEEQQQQQQQQQQQYQKQDASVIESLPIESICISAIFSVLCKVANHLVSYHGYARQDIVASGIVTVMGRMAHFFGATTTDATTTTTTTILTPAHSEFVQLCLLTGQYQYAITFASTFTAVLQYSNKKYQYYLNSSNSIIPPPLTPLTVEYYLRYYYSLGNIYMLDGTRNYTKALDLWNICITTPTTTPTSSSTHFHQRQPSTTPTSSDITASKVALAVHPLQIAARKKQLLVSCLVACSNVTILSSPTATSDSSSSFMPSMSLNKSSYVSSCDNGDNNNHDMGKRVSIQAVKDTYTTSIEEDQAPNAQNLGQKPHRTAIGMAAQGSNATNPKQSSTNWPWSLPMYTSTCVFNLFFLDPSVYYNYYKQQQIETTTTPDTSPNIQEQQQQQGSVKLVLQELEQYNSLIAAYWYGDVPSFRQMSLKMKDLFRQDGTYDLVLQLEESFVFRMIYTLAHVYEAMPIQMLVDYLILFDKSTTIESFWRLLERAMEYNVDFSFDIDQQNGFVHFCNAEQGAADRTVSPDKMKTFISLAERIKALDIDIATSKKYQTFIRSKEPTGGNKQGAASGATSKPKTSTSTGGNISGGNDRVTWI